jgi:c-di-GMP-binding flagellar brake protein YcgR
MTTKDAGSERRKFERAVFTLEDGVIGILSVPGIHDRSIQTNILNISEGGIQFTLDAQNKNKIRTRDRVVVLQIKAPATLKFLVNIDAEVKWVLHPDMFEFAGVGCQFINISPSSREQISAFVEAWNESRA